MTLNSVMVKESDLERGELTISAAIELLVDEKTDTPIHVAHAERYQETFVPDCILTTPAQVDLNFEDLVCFEVVDRQFQKWGVTFNNCIAIRPSNPAFPPHSGNTVLMGAPKNGWLEAVFHHPVKSVSAFVTTSQKLVLTAYNQDNQTVKEVEISEPNLAGSDSTLSPNILLTVTGADIYRVTYCAFDGQFILDDFKFQL
ncbi:hypothetical protein ACE1B6_06075 [Aerosakkonemataceae cyanobacterium BLCC-F154]|uniref:Uncharacterized protein n=1 Tax=Floridaenema fluviatile BLCC-F154 TaxID=3153640 RepID=A0ABV4Y7T9_9CYAN